MKNPLALFTGAALATLAALAGLNFTDWPRSSPDGQKPAEAAVEAPKPETGTAAQKPAAEATEEASKTPEKPAEMAAIPAPEPPRAEAEGKLDLDTVRVESDGQTIVAGRAKPGAEVALKLGDQVIGKGIANSDGSWVVVPDQPLPKGGHEITVEQKVGDEPPVPAAESIAVAVPEKPGQQAMVVVTKPGTASKVLQAGGYQEQASLAQAEQPKPAETAPVAAQQPKTEEPAAAGQKPADATVPQEQAAKPAEQTTTVAKTEPKTEDLPEAVKPPEPAPEAKPAGGDAAENVALSLDAVDYNDKGDIIFSGRAKPGTAVRLYVDNRAVGDAIVNSQGSWTFAGKDIIAPGTHELRADQIDKAGKVLARIELPFLRENAEAVAALNTPEPEKTEAQEPPQASEAEPSQPTVEPPTQKTAEQPQPTTTEQPQTTAQQQTTAEQPQTTTEPSPQKTAEKPQTTTEPSPQKTAEPPQTTNEPAKTAEPEVSAPQPSAIAEAQPPKAAEVQKTEPEASGLPPDQPVAEEKKEDVTTAAAAAVEEAAKALDPNTPRSGKVVIQPGNNLWKLSRVIYGRGKNYTVIYQANKDQIRNPARIYPGQIFAVPGATPPEMIDPKRKEPLTSAEGGAAQ